MNPYRGGGTGSGVAAYEYGPDWILIHFHRGGSYRYDARHPGLEHVLEMQRLADAGSGLNSYINRRVRDDYATRIDAGWSADSRSE